MPPFFWARAEGELARTTAPPMTTARTRQIRFMVHIPKEKEKTEKRSGSVIPRAAAGAGAGGGGGAGAWGRDAARVRRAGRGRRSPPTDRKRTRNASHPP